MPSDFSNQSIDHQILKHMQSPSFNTGPVQIVNHVNVTWNENEILMEQTERAIVPRNPNS
jgi:hypothetical protein